MSSKNLKILAAYNDLVDLLDEKGMALQPALALIAKQHKLSMQQRLALVKHHDEKLQPHDFPIHAASVDRYGK